MSEEDIPLYQLLEGLEDELPAGAPMDHPLFPVLRVRG